MLDKNPFVDDECVSGNSEEHFNCLIVFVVTVYQCNGIISFFQVCCCCLCATDYHLSVVSLNIRFFTLISPK